MSDTIDSEVQRLHPNTDEFGVVGIALIANDWTTAEVRDLYHRTGSPPKDVHPLLLFEVESRGRKVTN